MHGGVADLVADRPTRALRSGTRLYHEGDRAEAAHFILDGLVKLVRSASDGSQALLDLRGPGRFVGAHSAIDGQPRLATAQAVTDLTVASIPCADLVGRIGDDASLARELLVRSARHLRELTLHVSELAARDPVALVARRVCQLGADPEYARIRRARGSTIIVEMPLTQEELAGWAGVSHRSVATALRDLRDAGLISTSRMHLEIHDLAGVAAETRPRATEPQAATTE